MAPDQSDYDDGADAQAEWIALAADVRQALAAKVKDVAAMNAQAAGMFVDACRAAVCLDVEARSFAANVAHEKYAEGD